MNLEMKFLLTSLLEKYIEKVPTNEEELFMNELAHITSIDVVRELCEALCVFEVEEERI